MAEAKAVGKPGVLSRSQRLNRRTRAVMLRFMNGQPPSLPPQPPPAPVPPPQVVQLPRQGAGCFATGCLTLLIIGFIFLAGLVGGTWYLFVKTVDNLTSPAPADIQIEAPSESQFQTAESSLARLRKAIANNEATTVEFTAADLNALLARDSDFKDLRGRTRIEIADSTMTIALSAPLNSIPLPRVKKRWFNGTVRFSFTYESGEFSFDIKSAEAGGHTIPSVFLSSSAISSFNDSFNRSFWNDHDRGSEFWNHIKTLSLDGDKLVVTTQTL
jgi:hypothetical protein